MLPTSFMVFCTLTFLQHIPRPSLFHPREVLDGAGVGDGGTTIWPEGLPVAAVAGVNMLPCCEGKSHTKTHKRPP